MSLKFAVFVVLVALASAEEPCREHIRKLKADPSLRMDADACTSRHGKFNLHIDLIHGLVNEHISQSFLYSSMSSHFASDKVNRLGLSKFMGGLADNMWSDAIELIKYVGTRGAGMAPSMDPAKTTKTGLHFATKAVGGTVDGLTEVEAFAWALDSHHEIASQVHYIHSQTRDAALIGFLEKEFTAKHADSIRELSGALSNLVPMSKDAAGREMALYLFDQTYLG